VRVAIVSKALVVGAYQRKCELIAQELSFLGQSCLCVYVPPNWGSQSLQIAFTHGYELKTLPIWLSGNYHLHFYPSLAKELQAFKPDVLHIDEEPYNLATFLALRAGKSMGCKTVVFSWQNLFRNYPPPFRWMESAVLKSCDAAIVGSVEAQHVLKQKYTNIKTHVIPQFGVDENVFTTKSPRGAHSQQMFTVGYAGRLVYEKGVDLILKAIAPLQNVKALIVGEGDQLPKLKALAKEFGLGERCEFRPNVPSTHMVSFYHVIDAFVLPSRTLPNWKEQFGRVLIEAMSCGVPVIGARSGEIPSVIGELDDSAGGLLFNEDDVAGLRSAIERLVSDNALHAAFATFGRQRVLEHYTMRHISEQTVKVYCGL
jgi:glycosyltransferase involved in cell wall biosynthesis